MTTEDETETMRRELQALTNGMTDEQIKELGAGEKEYTTAEMQAEFLVLGFAAPFVVVERLSDGKKGSLQFRHSPRKYFGWKAD